MVCDRERSSWWNEEKDKSKTCSKRFPGTEDPRSDSPTLAKESLKTIMAIAADEKFTTNAWT